MGQVKEAEVMDLKESLRDRELRETDVTVRVVLQRIREALDACIVGMPDGVPMPTKLPDHKVRLMAIAQAREVLGLSGPKGGGVRLPNITILIGKDGA